ncbi:MAG: XRE family transcriptional regulator [Kordiimonas sp.]
MSGQNWIKVSLKSEGHKLKDVAEALGITSPRVTDIIKGTREVQADELLPLSEMLGLSVNSLLLSLKEGERREAATETTPSSLPIRGYLLGDGSLTPLGDDDSIKVVAVPADAQKPEGLYCYIMGDNSMGSEIKAGDIIIAADPRIHFYPMVPGGIFLVAGPNDTLAARQFVKTDSGESWLVPTPSTPNPAYESWRFEMLPPSLNTKAQSDQTSANDDTQNADHRTVYTDDIFAAVLWVHRRYMPVSSD